MQKTATNINTANWHDLIKHLLNQGWRKSFDYQGFDKGIDFDLVILKKEKQTVLFGWDNWSDGEIKCDEKLFEYFTATFGMRFEFGQCYSLKPSVVLWVKLMHRLFLV